MNIIITGGDGFLGKHVAEELKKHTVKTLSNKKTADICADITNLQSIKNALKGYDTIYHLAGNTRTPQTDSKQIHMTINVEGTRNVLEACITNNIKRMIFISTVEVYGEKKEEHIDELARENPKNDYALSKFLAEQVCQEYANKISIVIIRLAYIYGPGQPKERMIPKLINCALEKRHKEINPTKGGNDYLYVKDAARAIVLLGTSKKIGIFNVASGKFTQNKEIFAIIKELTGYEYEEVNDCKEKVSYSIEKLKKIGYQPKYTLQEGLKEVIP